MFNVRRILVALQFFIWFHGSATCLSAQSSQQPAPSQEQHQHSAGSDQIELFPLREASGTAWQPETTPMQGFHGTLGGWGVMLHGSAFAQFLYEPGDRHRTGGSATRQASSVNWIMGMARRSLGGARVGFRGMLSLEPWTVSDCGYLNFLATGEICDGDTIHDRQHPHDQFMELAGDYDRPLRGSLRWQVYAGLAGEPALGPAAFPHRLSAMANPVAPVSHHWLDSTHITFGLVTFGVYGRRWKTELSVFNGREPDTNRADLDLGPLDSISGRVSILASEHLSLQVSAAHLNEAEAGLVQQPRIDVDRATASATLHTSLGDKATWSTTLAYGVNGEREIIPGGVFDGTTHAVLLESTLARDRQTWFGRAEVVGKPAHDLHAHEFGAGIFAVGKLQVGYEHQVGSWSGLRPALGATVTASVLPAALAPRYSGRIAVGVGVFVSVRPLRHTM